VPSGSLYFYLFFSFFYLHKLQGKEGGGENNERKKKEIDIGGTLKFR